MGSLVFEAFRMWHVAEKPIIEFSPSLFAEKLNRAPFAFRHRLVDDPLFGLPNLVALCQRVKIGPNPKHLVAFQANRGSPQTKFTKFAKEQDPSEIIGGLAQGDSVVRLSNAQLHDDRLRLLHERVLSEIDVASGFSLGREIGWSSMTILISSPGTVTPYHIDHQSNLLFQVRGQKSISVFDRADRRLLQDVTIERYYRGQIYAADYDEAFETQGTIYRLGPGDAIHNPPLGPHWVKNGNEVSVSVSINFSLRACEAAARIYQVNYYLRRLGLAPVPPGRSAIRDWIKSAPLKGFARSRPRNLEDLVQSGPGRFIGPIAAARRALLKMMASAT